MPRLLNRLGERGSALVEVAILTPVLLILLLGAIELGRFEHFNILIASAARAGVQFAGLNSANSTNSSGIYSAVTADVSSDLSGLTVTSYTFCQCPNGTASTCQATDCSSTHYNHHVEVSVVGTYKFLFWYFGVKSAIITRDATMTVLP